MKIIGSVKEDLNQDKRISVTPETVKKFKDLNFSVFIEKNYGEHLGISDKEYRDKGADLKQTKNEILKDSQIILKVNSPSENEIDFINKGSIIIGQFDPFVSKEILNKFIKKKN